MTNAWTAVGHDPDGAWRECTRHQWDHSRDLRVPRPDGTVAVYLHCRRCPVGTLRVEGTKS